MIRKRKGEREEMYKSYKERPRDLPIRLGVVSFNVITNIIALSYQTRQKKDYRIMHDYTPNQLFKTLSDDINTPIISNSSPQSLPFSFPLLLSTIYLGAP